jgi:hypothetical protein
MESIACRNPSPFAWVGVSVWVVVAGIAPGRRTRDLRRRDLTVGGVTLVVRAAGREVRSTLPGEDAHKGRFGGASRDGSGRCICLLCEETQLCREPQIKSGEGTRNLMVRGECYRCGNPIQTWVSIWRRRRLCSNCVEVSLTRQQAEVREDVHQEQRTIGHELMGPWHDRKYSGDQRSRR